MREEVGHHTLAQKIHIDAHDCCRRHGFIRPLAIEYCCHQNAERIHVHSGTALAQCTHCVRRCTSISHVICIQHLWGHITGGANILSHRSIDVRKTRHAKVGQLRRPIMRQHHIAWFDVTMDNFHVMHVPTKSNEYIMSS